MAFVVVVCGQVTYHILFRGLAQTVSPFLPVAVAYFTGLVVVTTLYFVTREGVPEVGLSWYVVTRGFALGLAVTCVEVGYVFAYRHGLPVNVGALSILAVTTLALIPIGSVGFGETLTIRNLVGGALALAGVWLVRT